MVKWNSSPNNKSSSESENMDADPDFNESSSPVRRSGRRMSARKGSESDRDHDHDQRRPKRESTRKYVVYEESDSDSEYEDDVAERRVSHQANGNEKQANSTEVKEEAEEEDGTMPVKRSSRIAEKSKTRSWLLDSMERLEDDALSGHRRSSSRWNLRSRRPPAISFREEVGESLPMEEDGEAHPKSNGVSGRDEGVVEEGQEQPATENGVRHRRRVRISEFSEAEEEGGGGDMYSRLKERSSKRSGRIDYREQSRMSRMYVGDQEPIRRRLRERRTLNQSDDQQRSQSTLDEMFRKLNRHKLKRRRKRSSSSASSSSSSSGDGRRERPRQTGHDKAEKVGSKTGFMDLQPNEVDPTITFASVGGLLPIIEKLRETVILPLLYKEFYADRYITPPRGILFHGPPGTGKTMLARALVNECSALGGQKVTFFVRKGGDLLSKWVGESEKQLRGLFEEAYRCQPSIIFFDEIDGLAPVRSSKTDQVHNSVVSTLLAELDGVKDRGDVIIIGATNRIDSIDPALRRPGRFDHEFGFFLPTLKDRTEILTTLTRKWKGDQIPGSDLSELAKSTVGYSGADLKLLCAEASVSALRRRYPQIYTSTSKYLLDYDSIKVEPCDWRSAMEKIKPSSTRIASSIIATGQPLPNAVVPLLQNVVTEIEDVITKLFPLRDQQHLMNEPGPKRFLVYAAHHDSGIDQYILPAVLHCFESIPVFVLNFENSTCKDPGLEAAAIMRIFNEADRIKKLAIILIPSMNILLQGLSSQGQEFLHQQIMRASAKPVLLLATSEPQSKSSENSDEMETDAPFSLVTIFKGFCKEVSHVGDKSRKEFFKPLFSEKSIMIRAENETKFTVLEELPLAPPPPPKQPSPEELKITEKREAGVHRRLRKFLREVLGKLVRNKKFRDFLVPVTVEEVPDYYDIIKNPMCLETMMCKLDLCQYMSAKDFLADIFLIRDNAIEYNPVTSDEGKAIRHAACELVDQANLIVDDEMNSDFEEVCLAIVEDRKKRATEAAVMPENTIANSAAPKAGSSKDAVNSSAEVITNGNVESPAPATPQGTKRKFRSAVGNHTKQRKLSAASSTSSSTTPSLSPGLANSTGGGSSKVKETSPASVSSPKKPQRPPLETYTYTKAPDHDEYEKQLRKLLAVAVKVTEGIGVNSLLDLRYQLLLEIETYHSVEDKKDLLKEMRHSIYEFHNIHKPTNDDSMEKL